MSVSSDQRFWEEFRREGYVHQGKIVYVGWDLHEIGGEEDDWLDALGDASRWEGVERVTMSNTATSGEQLEQFSLRARMSELRWLLLANLRLRAETVDALAQSPILEQLELLDLCANPDVGLEGLASLLYSGKLTQMRELRLVHCGLDDRAVDLFRACPPMPHLKVLLLSVNGISAAAAERLRSIDWLQGCSIDVCGDAEPWDFRAEERARRSSSYDSPREPSTREFGELRARLDDLERAQSQDRARAIFEELVQLLVRWPDRLELEEVVMPYVLRHPAQIPDEWALPEQYPGLRFRIAWNTEPRASLWPTPDEEGGQLSFEHRFLAGLTPLSALVGTLEQFGGANDDQIKIDWWDYVALSADNRLQKLTLRFYAQGEPVGPLLNLLASPALRSLKHLGLEEMALTYPLVDIARTIAENPALGSLRVLDFRDVLLGEEGCLAIARSPYLRSLKVLDLASGENHCNPGVTDRVLDALVSSPLLDTLERLLIEGPNSPFSLCSARAYQRLRSSPRAAHIEDWGY